MCALVVRLVGSKPGSFHIYTFRTTRLLPSQGAFSDPRSDPRLQALPPERSMSTSMNFDFMTLSDLRVAGERKVYKKNTNGEIKHV